MLEANPSDTQAAGSSLARQQDVLQLSLPRISLAANLQMSNLKEIKKSLEDLMSEDCHDPAYHASLRWLLLKLVTELIRIEKLQK